MSNKTKKSNKFKFITLDENGKVVEDDSFFKEKELALREEKIQTIERIKESEYDTKSLKELVDVSLKNPRKIPTIEELDKTQEFKNHKKYVSFEVRVAVRIVIILFLFATACCFVLMALNKGKKDIITYNEITETNYSVCENNAVTNFYDSKCLDEDLTYDQSVSNYINVLFKYNLDYSKALPYDIAYHVVAVTKIYDKDNNTKELFKNEDVLVERTSISDISDRISFDNSINLDYKQYNSLVAEKAAKYGNAEANLEVSLYLDTEKESTNVASVTIPLNENPFKIRKSSLSNLNKTMEIDNDVWNDFNSMCAIIASILIVIALTILYRTTRLVLKVVNNKSEYEKALDKILKEHDDDIVNAKDGYVVDSTKTIIKVADFGELLDARHLLDKPIIYTKINSVKSEFIVEDEEKAFKYILKDSDL